MKKFFITNTMFSAVVDEFVISDIRLDIIYNNSSNKKLSYYFLLDFTTGNRSFEYKTDFITNITTEQFTTDDAKYLTSQFSNLMTYFQKEIKHFLNSDMELCTLNLDEIVNHFLQLNGYKIEKRVN